MIVHFYIFYSRMKQWVCRQYVAPKLSHHKAATVNFTRFNSVSKVCIHIISTVAFVIALYSASVLDLETVDCFLALHKIRFDPRKIAKPPIYLLSSRHPAQSASEKPLTSIEGDLIIRKPTLMVPLIYLKILLTSVRCRVIGAYKYWQTLLTEKAKSG
jgi:hypothetical protein